MINSKLLILLRRLDTNEFKELEKFVASPYHARGRDFISLFKILKPFYPDFNNDQLNRQNLFKKLYPDEKYSSEISDHKLRMIFTPMYKLCLDFLIHNGLNKDTKMKQFYLLDQLRLKKLYKEFENLCSESNQSDLLSSNQEDLERGGTKDFIKKYFLNSVYTDYSLDMDDFTKTFEFGLSASENIVIAALMECIRFEDQKNLVSHYSLSPRYTILNNLLESLDSDRLLNEMKKNNDKLYPYVLIFFMIYKMNKYRDKPEYFHDLKKLLIEHQNLFGQSENYNFWNIMLTYCNTVYLPMEEHFSIYDYILKNNIYKKSCREDFDIIRFRNIVYICTSAGSAGKNEWLENFIEKHSGEINIKHRENMHNFSYAHLNFSKGKFNEALGYINKIDYNLFIFKIDVRTLLFKIYFELSYFEQAYSLIHSTFNFLKSTNEFSEYVKDNYLNAFKYFKELLKLKSSNELQPYSILFLKKKIANEILIQKPWIRKKIEEMLDPDKSKDALPDAATSNRTVLKR